MFQQFYAFNRQPFSRDIPSNDLFPAETQMELAARLDYLVRERGLGMLTGETGSGKSTAVRRFADTLDANRYFVVYLANPLLGMYGIYRELLTALGHEPPFSKPKMIARIRTVLDDLIHSKRRIPFVIFDEAHLLPAAAFEQLRLLFSTSMDSQSLGALLLVGQPELHRILRLAVHEAFHQRLTTIYHLPPLNLSQTTAYIRHHVQFAGHLGNSLFTDDAIARIYDHTKGVPRLINRLCIHALIAGAIENKSIIEESLVRKAIADLDLS